MKKWMIGILSLLLALVLSAPVSAEAATSEQRERCKQVIMNMLYLADTDAKSISQYRMTAAELDDLCAEIRYGEGAEIFGGYYPTVYFSYTYGLLGEYVRTIRLANVNTDALYRYEQMVPIIDSIVAGIEEDMTDLDKLIYLHDVVVETVEYKKTTDAVYIASGALVDKQAVCSGYAKALNVLLHRVGVETSYVSGTSLNHGWSYVKLDGQWYHVDPTWDDTTVSPVGKTGRKNLLRNDAEFGKDHGVWEVRVIDETSESTIYENWLVHDIVGDMRFEDGLWYYVDTSSRKVVAIDAVSNSKETVFSYSNLGNVVLVDAVDDQLILKVNGKEVSQTIEEWKAMAEEAEKNVHITPDGNTVFPMDYSDIAYWRTGHYDATYGAYCLNRTRICLNELIENVQERYVVTIGAEDYKVAIREYNEKKKIIGSVELSDGEVYVPSEGVIYLGVSIYNNVQSKSVSYDVYEEMFVNGLVVGFNLNHEEQEPDCETEETVNGTNGYPLDFSDIAYWRTGHYDATYGAYCLNRTRVCLNDLIENMQEQYVVTIGAEDYKVAIREYNSRKKIIGSAELGDGEVYIPSEEVIYLGISIYNNVQSKGVSFEVYEEMFANGLVVGFNLDVEE